MSIYCMFTNTTPINHFFLFQLNAHEMLNKYKYHQLPPTCCSVCYTICRETFVLHGIKWSDWLQEWMKWKASKQPLLVLIHFLFKHFFTHVAIFRNAVTKYNDSHMNWTFHTLTVYLHCKGSKGRVETLISSSTKQTGDKKSDLVGWVKVSFTCWGPNSFSYRSSARSFVLRF
jgi:hypothetical protein